MSRVKNQRRGEGSSGGGRGARFIEFHCIDLVEITLRAYKIPRRDGRWWTLSKAFGQEEKSWMVPRNNNTNRGVKRGKKKKKEGMVEEDSEEAQVEADVSCEARDSCAPWFEASFLLRFRRFDILEESRNRPTTTTATENLLDK